MAARSFFMFSDYSVPESYRAEVDAQCRRDILARQRQALYLNPGVFLLVALSILIAEPTQTKFLLLSSFGVALLAAMTYRWWALRQFSRSVDSPGPGDWRHLYASLSSSVLVWGIFLACSVADTPLQNHFILAYTGTLGLTAGGMVALSLQPVLVRIFLAGMLSPTILIVLAGQATVHPGLAGLLVVFAFGMKWISGNARAEYMVAVLNNLILQEQSAKLTKLTTVDWLTKVHNRSHFDKILEQELLRVSRIGYDLSLLMIDIDHFKAINDTYGHLVGDQCLEATANQIKSCLKRETDIVARYGGEEFCVLLPGMGQAESADMAESIRDAVARSTIWHFNNPIQLTVSIGGASIDQSEPTSRESILRAADAALYRAKEGGRNQVCWHHQG